MICWMEKCFVVEMLGLLRISIWEKGSQKNSSISYLGFSAGDLDFVRYTNQKLMLLML